MSENMKPNSDFLIEEFKEAFTEKGMALDEEKRFSEPDFLVEGGYKALYKIKDLWTDRLVVKAIPKDDSPESLEAFMYESQLLASLQHPNILPVYDVGTEEDTPFMIMKLIEGKSLGEFLKKNPKNDYRIEIFEKICDAVSYAHSKGICHLDLKPDNIRISAYGDVTVCDWGSARRLSELENTQLAATPGYIAPEALKGKLSKGCDIYALGAIFYEILTRSPLYKGANLKSVLKANERGRVSLSKIKDPSLRSICAKALEANPAKRLKSVSWFHDYLDCFFKRVPVPIENAGVFRRINLLIKRRPITVALTALFLAVLSVSFAYFAFTFNKQKTHAQKLMKQYREERGKRVNLTLKHSVTLHKQAWQMYDDFLHVDSSELLKLSIAGSGYDEKKYELEGLLFLMDFEIEKARASFIKGNALENYKVYLELIPNKGEMLNFDIKKLSTMVMAVRKKNSSFYHHVLGAVFTRKEFSNEKKEKFLVSVLKALAFSKKVIVSDNGRALKVTGNAGDFPTYILQGLRLNKLDFSGCSGMPSSIRIKELNDCVELQELDLRRTNFSSLYLLKNNNIKILHLPARKFDRVDHVQSMPLERLSLKGVKLKSLNFLLQIPTLKIVTIDESMKKISGYEELSKKIQVVLEK